MRGHRDSAKNNAELEESDITNFGNLGIESKEGIKTLRKEAIETLRTMFKMAHECLMFYCFSLDFFVCFCGISR